MSIRAAVWTAISLSAASCGFNPVGQNTQGNCTSGTGTIVLENMAGEAVSVAVSGSDGSGSAVTVAAGGVSVVDDPVGSYTLTATGMTSTDTLLTQSVVVLCNVDQEVVVPSGSDATLSIALIGGGTGHVDSSAFAIACSSDDNGSASCTAPVVPNTTVTLVATADPGSTFAAWSGGCGSAGTSSTCMLDVGSGATATAEFTADPPTPESLTVALMGTGSGTVTSEPGGIACSNDGGGALCMANFDSGTLVTLVAVPAPSSVFAGWSGGGCGGTSTFCSTTIGGAESVTATFTLATETLFVGTTGSGTVTSSPAGISCGSTCSASFNYGQLVTLSESPGTNWAFASWSGACTGTGACSVTMTASKGVNATFTQPSELLTVSKSGSTGTGTVAGGPISCGSTCMGSVTQGTSVTLTATPDAGSTFTGWSGGGCTGTSTCTTTVTAATTVTATFGLQSDMLSVSLDGGTGGESVTGTLGGPTVINCPGTCSVSESFGATIVLTAHTSNSSFLGWAGAGSGSSGCGGTGTCTVTLDAAENVTALFQSNSEQLQVKFAGSGSGSVLGAIGASDVLSCDSPATCAVSEPYDTMITLTAAANGSDSFTSWSGGGCSGTGACTVTITSATTVTATFAGSGG